MNEVLTEEKVQTKNPLAYEDTKKLLKQYAIPSVISLLVGALYNIVDQIFIGQGVGLYGNAATNVAFPFNTLALSAALLLGIGAAAAYNLYLGKGDEKRARDIIQNMLVSVVVLSIIIMALSLIFLDKLLVFFGATEVIMDLSRTYMGIIALGLPFFMFSTAFSHTIRADGSPKFGMTVNLIGAGLNTILDPLFIFVFDWGIAGAAWATIISQMVAAVISFTYVKRIKYVKLDFSKYKPDFEIIKEIALFGMSPFFTQISLMVFQIVFNNILRHYGAISQYGAEVPLAVVGVVSKVNFIYISMVLGVSQGAQLIAGFNYGSEKYERTKKVMREALMVNMTISVIAFLILQIFPNQILALFGDGGELYFKFGRRYMRIFLFTTLFNGIQPLIAQFFTAIGQPKMGTVIALTRQILFLVPLVYILAKFFGIDGVLFSGPIADTASVSLSVYFLINEMRNMDKLIKERDGIKEF